MCVCVRAENQTHVHRDKVAHLAAGMWWRSWLPALRPMALRGSRASHEESCTRSSSDIATHRPPLSSLLEPSYATGTAASWPRAALKEELGVGVGEELSG